MKKLKPFFVWNYQRFFRFLISFSAIGCILVSSFAVGAVTSFTPAFGAPTYFYAVDRDGTVWEYSTENPGPCTFKIFDNYNSQVGFSPNIVGPSSIIIDIPFSLSIPDDSYFSGSFKFQCKLYFSGVSSWSRASDFSVTLFSSDGSSLPVSVGGSSFYPTIIVPASLSYESIRFSFNGLVSDNWADTPIRTIRCEFRSFDFVYGSSQDFANTNISAFLDVIGSFFSQVVSFLSSCLAIIVASPALTVLCLAMPICGFSVLLLRRFIHI